MAMLVSEIAELLLEFGDSFPLCQLYEAFREELRRVAVGDPSGEWTEKQVSFMSTLVIDFDVEYASDDDKVPLEVAGNKWGFHRLPGSGRLI